MESIRIYSRLVRRIRAVLIDSAIAILVLYSWWMTLPLFDDHSTFIKLAYPFIIWVVLDPIMVSRAGYTPGHYVMGLMVQDAGTAKNIGLLRAILRSLLRTLTGWWSFIFVLTTNKHQALHDLLVGTVVVLRNPETLPQSEHVAERFKDVDNFIYPSGARRILIIVVYIILSTNIIGLLNAWAISGVCINDGYCLALKEIISYVTSVLLLCSVVGIIVCGWRCQIFGARRKAMVSTE
ncbi:MAG: RDD family protein [Gammaproteobacteria bacterium]|nr:RDD family protein [Gammaproteobacteria bacterium]